MTKENILPEDKEWKIFEDNDGLIITNSFCVVDPEIFSIAVQFENEYRSMGEDYSPLTEI